MRLKTQVTVAILAATSLAFAVPASAQGSSRHAATPRAQAVRAAQFAISKLDANGDGKVTKDEIAAARAANAAALDQNGDGKIDASELVAREMAKAEDRAKALIARLDADKDGVLSAAELMTRPTARTPARFGTIFDRIDTNGDGAVSAAEFDAAKAQLRARANNRRDAEPRANRGGNQNGHAMHGNQRGNHGFRPGSKGSAGGGNAGQRGNLPFARHR